jgi:plasmid stability protein
MTITIRTDEVLREALEQRAAAEGRSLSEVARDLLRNALTERPLQKRVGHLRGRLELRRGARQEWRESLRGHNWRP